MNSSENKYNLKLFLAISKIENITLQKKWLVGINMTCIRVLIFFKYKLLFEI